MTPSDTYDPCTSVDPGLSHLLATALDAAPVGICVFDEDLRYVIVNEELARLNGLPASAHIGRRAEEVLPGVDAHVFDAIRSVFGTGVAIHDFEVVGETLAAPGERRYWVENYRPVAGPDGSTQFVVCSVLEITERHRAEEALEKAAAERARLLEAERAARRALETVIDAMPVGVSVADASGRLQISNEQLTTIWRGTKPSRSIDEYGEWKGFHPDGRRYAGEEWPLGRTLVSGEIIIDEEVRIERFDGSPSTISLSSAPIRGDDGSILGGVAVVTDINERAEHEALRDAFIGVLSHELRTPVTTIVGVAELLLRRADENDADLLADLVHESERLERRVRDLVVLSQVERHLPLEGRTHPILLQRVVPQILRSHERHAFRIELLLPSDLPPVEGRDDYLEQILGNLISNTEKYGHERAIVCAELSRSAVVISVTDDGPGVPPEDVERIFGPYFRSPSSVDRAAGAGIGLFVVRHLVEALDGRIWVERAPDGGARFSFTLPLVATDDG